MLVANKDSSFRLLPQRRIALLAVPVINLSDCVAVTYHILHCSICEHGVRSRAFKNEMPYQDRVLHRSSSLSLQLIQQMLSS